MSWIIAKTKLMCHACESLIVCVTCAQTWAFIERSAGDQERAAQLMAASTELPGARACDSGVRCEVLRGRQGAGRQAHCEEAVRAIAAARSGPCAQPAGEALITFVSSHALEWAVLRRCEAQVWILA